MQGDDFENEPGGIMEVAMWICVVMYHYYVGFDLVWV